MVQRFKWFLTCSKMVLINFFFEKNKKLLLKKNILRRWVKWVVKEESKDLGCVNFVFCSDDYLLEINKKHLKHTSLTDVITFDFSENEKTIEGDIYISTKRIDENAKKYSVSFNQELLRIMIHGMLHLIGYSDKNQEGKTTMFSKENKYLSMYNKK